jgi:hypothetical protein
MGRQERVIEGPEIEDKTREKQEHNRTVRGERGNNKTTTDNRDDQPMKGIAYHTALVLNGVNYGSRPIHFKIGSPPIPPCFIT